MDVRERFLHATVANLPPSLWWGPPWGPRVDDSYKRMILISGFTLLIRASAWDEDLRGEDEEKNWWWVPIGISLRAHSYRAEGKIVVEKSMD